MAKWIIDSDHSVAAFAVRHLMVAYVRGQFNKVTGTILYEPGDIGGASIELTIDAASIVTGIQKRDDHLRSPDFFDVEKFPVITFRSSGIVAQSENAGRVSGDLSLHGVTRPVTLDVTLSGPVKSPFGGETTMGFCAAATINREEFGIRWNEKMDGGGLMIGREVQLSIDIEADLAEQ